MTNEILTANVADATETVLTERRAKLLKLAQKQGVKSFDPYQKAGDFWYDGADKSEDFDVWLRQLRHDAPARRPLE